MKNFAIALATIAALTMGALSTADAQGKGRRDGAYKQRNTSVQHRAGPRNLGRAVERRHARRDMNMRHGGRRGFDRPGKRVWRMKHRRHGWKRGYRKHKRLQRRYHRRFHRRFRGPYRHHPHAYRSYPVYEASPVESHGLEIETEEFRFKVYGSS
jgi:hypothetical protein